MEWMQVRKLSPDFQPEKGKGIWLDLYEEQKECVDYEELKKLRSCCVLAHVPMHAQTLPGRLIKDGREYFIPASFAKEQAAKAKLEVIPIDPKELDVLFARLEKSSFRSSFSLKKKDLDYIEQKSLPTICSHAYDFLHTRLEPAFPKKDGRQTPTKGHPVFVAAHATATCCRGCLEKWHHIPAGKELSSVQCSYIVQVQMAWIENQCAKAENKAFLKQN
jgi:hypothetical protein